MLEGVMSRAIAYEITATSLRRKPESRDCNLLDFCSETIGTGHWIPAFAGMTVVKPSICGSPVGLRVPALSNQTGRLSLGRVGAALTPGPSPSGRGGRVLHRWTGWTGFLGVVWYGIATWFDRLTMSGCARRNDKVGTREDFMRLPAIVAAAMIGRIIY